MAIGRAPPPGLARAMRRDAVNKLATESGKFPPKMVLTRACKWVLTSAFVIAESRKCSNVIPDGPAPTPFSHLPNILAKSAWAIESVDPSGVGQITSSSAAPWVLLAQFLQDFGARPVPWLKWRVDCSYRVQPPVPLLGIRSPDLRQLRFPSSDPSCGLPATPMVIAGAPEPSPERAAAWSAVVAKPRSEPEKATTAPKPPVAPAPKPAIAVVEKTLPPVPVAPLGVGVAGPSAPVVAPPVPLAALVPLASVAPTASAPAGGLAGLPDPVPGAFAVPAASVPDVPAPASASSPKAASATTVGPAPMGPRGAFRPPVTMADLQREVSRAVREEGASQSQSSSLRAVPAPVAPRPTAPPEVPPPAAALPPPVLAPSAPSPSVAAAAPGARLHLPPVPPVAGVEFVAAGGDAAAAQYAADEPLQFLAEALQPPQTRVPQSTLGQLHRLAESLHALLIQVLAHSSLPVIPPESFRDRPRETCLDAADQLAVLLAPVLAAPAEGGAADVGQLDEAVRSLKQHLRAGSGAAAIGASTLVVRELWRSLTGVLHALGAHRM
ncbi:unnamed protein product [Closterium sp. Yama58-4]|nr:unnamed protein product [Closterium sp. Yama58-4]